MEEYTLPASQMCSVASEMTARHAGLGEFVDQEESSVMEFPKRESSEWTDEKHSLYLNSMEASFVDQLYNSLDMRTYQTQNDCSTHAISSRKNHASTRCPSGQFMVLHHGFWSRIDFKRENLVRNEANRPHVSTRNLWIQHFRNGNTHGATESLSPQEKASLIAISQQYQQTSCSSTEVTDQNFVEEDSAVQKLNTTCRKKRPVSESGNDQVLGKIDSKKVSLR